MFMSTVTVLDVFSAWVTIKYHALEMCVLLQVSFATTLLNIFKIDQKRVIAKIKRVPVFLKHSV